MTKDLNKNNTGSITPSNQTNNLQLNHTTDALIMANFLAGVARGNQSERALQDKARMQHDKERREETKSMSKSQIMKLKNQTFNGAKTYRALLQETNTTYSETILSEECEELISRLNFNETNKEFLTAATQKLIGDLSLAQIKNMTNYLENPTEENLDQAAKIMAENFQGINQEDAKEFFKTAQQNIGNNTNNTESFKVFIEKCIAENTNLTHSPTHLSSTHSPTHKPSKHVTEMPTSSSKDKGTTSEDYIHIIIGGIVLLGIAYVCNKRSNSARVEVRSDVEIVTLGAPSSNPSSPRLSDNSSRLNNSEVVR